MQAVTTADNEGNVKPILVMMMGLPASGKTTHAKELVKQGNFVRVNKDELRAMMDDGEHSKANEKRVLRIRDQIIIDALANGKNVVVDDTNFNPYHQQTLYGLAQKFGAEMRVRFMDTPLEMCIERDAKREKPVGDKVIRDMYNEYLAEPKAKKEEVKKKAVVNESNDKDLPECIIVDVDGTLAHIDESNPRNVYDASRAMEDILDDAVSIVAGMAYQNDYRVIIFSGRNRRDQEVTEQWLKLNNVNYDEIHLRNFDDKRPDTTVKKEMYEAFVKDKYRVKFVIDDRDSVVKMWREELGLKCFQAQPGDF